MKIFDRNNTEIIDAEVSDQSYSFCKIQEVSTLTMYLNLPEYITIPVGSYVDFEGERFTLTKQSNLKKNHSRDFEYTIVFDGVDCGPSKYRLKNTVDGRLKFSISITPYQLLQLVVDNLNMRESDWSIGNCITANAKLLSFSFNTIQEAIKIGCDAFETEYEITGDKTVSFGKVEYNKSNPLPLKYGKNEGLKPGVGRSNYDNSRAIEIVLPQGGERNITSGTLKLPVSQSIGFDGVYFDDQIGYDASKARIYMTDSTGSYVRRSDRELQSKEEGVLDCTEIYPNRIGTISSVDVVDEEKHLYDIIDLSIPDNLDYGDCRVEGEKATIIFQSGMLAGREFDLEQTEDSLTGYTHTKIVDNVTVPERRFKIVPTEYDGITMPGDSYLPAIDDTYAIFGISLPEAYVCDNATKSGASWDMFRECVSYLYNNEDAKIVVSGQIDGKLMHDDWLNVSSKIRLGGFVSFTDDQFEVSGILIRIISIKKFLNKPHYPEIDLSNVTVGSGVRSEISKIAAKEAKTEDKIKNSVTFTKRSFRDAKETIKLLQSDFDYFSGNIQPVSVETMMLLAGSESLQFIFVDSTTEPVRISDGITYNTKTKKLSIPAGIIQHRTLGITSITSARKATDFKYWSMSAYESAILEDATKSYRIYAKVEQSGETGSFILSETAIGMYDVSGYYHLLIGYLNSEYYKARSIARMYGFTEILPGQITADRFVSSDGNSFFDFVADALKMGNKLQYNVDGEGRLVLVGVINQDSGGNESPAIVDRKNYDPNETYWNGNIFQYNGSSYQCIKDAPVGTPPSNTTYFKILASKGETGATLYTWIKYSDYVDGTDLYDTPTNTTLFIGLAYNKTTATESNNKADYAWSKFRGEQGVPGGKGETGATLYTWIKYATSANGDGLTDDPTGMTYIGLAYNKTTATESTLATDYSWSLIKGDKGDTGVKGDKGDTGVKGDKGDKGDTGYAGSNARTVNLLSDFNVVRYNAAGANPDPERITFTAVAHNTTGTVYYEFLVNDETTQNTTESTYIYTPQSLASNMPDVVKVNIREVSNTSAILATDVFPVIALIDGSNILQVAQTNQYVQLAANYAGVVSDYSESGNIVDVYEGDDILKAISGTQPNAGEWEIYDTQATNITAGSQTVVNNDIVISAASAMTADQARIEYVIHGKRLDGREFELVFSQRFTKFKNGADGKGYEYIYTRTQTSETPTTPADGQTKSTSSPAETFQDDDWYPTDWTDDFVPPDSTYIYSWISKRIKTNGVWGEFSTPKVYHTYVKDGTDGTDGFDNVDLSLSQESVILSCMASGDPRTDTLPFDIYVFTRRGGALQDNDGFSVTPESSSSLAYEITEHYSNQDGITRIRITGISQNKSELHISANISNGSNPIPTLTKTLTINKQLDGYAGPAPIARGAFNSTSTYYGYPDRVDCIRNIINEESRAFKTKVTAGAFIGADCIPGVSQNWQDKWIEGNAFDFVAANTAFFEGANVAEFIFIASRLISQYGTINGVAANDPDSYNDPNFIPNLILDGKTGDISQRTGHIGGFKIGADTLESTAKDTSDNPLIKLINSTGGAELRNAIVQGIFMSKAAGNRRCVIDPDSGNLTMYDSLNRIVVKITFSGSDAGRVSNWVYLYTYGSNTDTTPDKITRLAPGEVYITDLTVSPTKTMYLTPVHIEFFEGSTSTLNIKGNVPTSPNGEFVGTVYRDGSTLKIKIS